MCFHPTHWARYEFGIRILTEDVLNLKSLPLNTILTYLFLWIALHIHIYPIHLGLLFTYSLLQSSWMKLMHENPRSVSLWTPLSYFLCRSFPCFFVKLPYGLPAAFLSVTRGLIHFWLNYLLEEELQLYSCFLVKVQHCNFCTCWWEFLLKVPQNKSVGT